MELIFRKNAGIVVFNRAQKVLLCERIDIPGSWQFPQGGIEAGETPRQAALRELEEETSLTAVEWVQTLETPARYVFPPQVRAGMQKRGYQNAGQDMYWSLFYFGGDSAQINLQTAEPEFRAYRWGTFAEACSGAVEFKKSAYQTAFTEFMPLIAAYCAKLPK